MTDYYMQDGRYFGEDTSFYEFDVECLKRKGAWKQMEEPVRDPAEDFDRLFTTRKLDMLKTAIPFLPSRQQKSFACAVKLVEFRNLVGYFGQDRQALLGACSDEDPEMRLADMLDALRGYCSPAEQEQIDSLFQILMTVRMMKE